MSQMTQTDKMFVCQAAINARKSANEYRAAMVLTDISDETLAFLSRAVANLVSVERRNWAHLRTMW